MNIFLLSEHETDQFGFRIARGSLETEWNPNEVRDEILSCNYDICRLKINLHSEDLYHNLDRLGFHWETFTILARTTRKIREEDKQYVPPEGITFQLYGPDHEAIISPVLWAGLSEKTAVNYTSDLHKAVFQGKETSSALQYYLSFNSTDERRYMYIMRVSGAIAGCYVLDATRDRFETPLVMVLPEFRNGGLVREIINHIFKSAAERGCSSGAADASLQNLPSLNAQISFGLRITDSHINIILYPMLSRCENLHSLHQFNKVTGVGSPSTSTPSFFKTHRWTTNEATGFRVSNSIEASSHRYRFGLWLSGNMVCGSFLIQH